MNRKDQLLLLLVTFLTVVTSKSQAQVGSDSLVDIFPLAIGNQWTYNYTYLDFDEYPDVYYADTGVVSYFVIGAILTQDSTRWVVRETRDLKYTYFSPGAEFPRADTSYAVIDTNIFELSVFPVMVIFQPY